MNIQDYIDKHYLTLEQMGKLCGVSKSAIWHYIKKTRNPNRRNALKISRATNNEISMKDLGYSQ